MFCMRLHEWFKVKGNTQTLLAERLGKSQSLMHQWSLWSEWFFTDPRPKLPPAGATRILADHAPDIEIATEGEVQKHEIRPDCYDPPSISSSGSKTENVRPCRL